VTYRDPRILCFDNIESRKYCWVEHPLHFKRRSEQEKIQMIPSRTFMIASTLLTLTFFLGLPVSTHAVTIDRGHICGWAKGLHSCITEGNGSPNPSNGSVTFVTGPGVPPFGVGSLRLKTNPGFGNGSAQLRNTNYAGVELSDLTNLTYWAYSAVNNLQQFPHLTLAVFWPILSSSNIRTNNR
jgi:hypothetical protein